MTKPLQRDEGLGHWVAEGAETVRDVLTHPACRVRPTDEPVPVALLGTPAGEIFAALARMSDGEVHASRRWDMALLLDGLDAVRVTEAAERCLAQLGPGLDRTALAYALPVRAVASLLGVPDLLLDEVTALISRFARCVFPGATAEQVELGKAVAGRLLQIATQDQIGAMVQSYDATAALILGRDPPAPATRRFLAEDVVIAETPLKQGEMVLVKLDTVPFGVGPHACPGRTIATTLAEVAERYLVASDHRADQATDARGDPHGERTPEGDPGRGP